MTLPSSRLVVAGLALLAAAGSARADYFYGWSADTPITFSDHSGMHASLTPGGNPVGPTGPVSGPQSVVAATLSTFINPGVSGTDTFSQGQRLGLGLQVVDGTASEKVRFAIGVSGSLTAGGNSQLSYSFLDGLTRDLTVNGHQYVVSLNSSITSTGNILATITPDAAGGGSSGGGGGGSGGGPSTAPEPSSLVLAVLGTASVVACYRRWRPRLRVVGPAA